MKIAQAPLEDWMRKYYFNTEIDIGSSGVENFSLTDLRRLTDLTQEEIDQITFHDSESLGALTLRRTIARRWGNGDARRVMVTHGSSEALFLIMNTLLRAGDEVIVLDPCYQSLRSPAEAIGCRLKAWPLRFEQRFHPDIEEFKTLLSANTRMVIVNFPHNPTGISLTREEQQAFIHAVADVGAYLVWDAAFADLTYDHPPLPDSSLCYERAISIGTLSKAYGLPGLRIGWCFADPEILAQCVFLRDYITLHLSPLVELVAQRAIESGDNLLDLRLRQARANLETLADWIASHPDTTAWVRPQGGVTAFVQLPTIPDVDAFCHQLANVYKVLLVPGSCFNRPQHVRLGFGGPTAAFQEGLSRLAQALRA